VGTKTEARLLFSSFCVCFRFLEDFECFCCNVPFFLYALAGFNALIVRGCLVPIQKLYTISHQMFGNMHGVLSIDIKITNCTVCMYFTKQIF
jgi:hypothetical protein